MAKQQATDLLKEQIRLLEIRQAEEGKLLKNQFLLTYESLKPINLLKSSASEFASSAELRETILESSAILISGFISKKMMSVSNEGPLMKLLSSLLQLGATNLIIKFSDQIQDFVLGFADRFLNNPKQKSAE